MKYKEQIKEADSETEKGKENKGVGDKMPWQDRVTLMPQWIVGKLDAATRAKQDSERHSKLHCHNETQRHID